jgi:hypothetical protein
MLSKEHLMDLVIVIQLNSAPLKMLDPVEACVSNLRRDTMLYLTAIYPSCESARSLETTDVLFESIRHKLNAVIS